MKLGIMLSGRGSTYEAIHQAILKKQLKAEIIHVVSSNLNAKGLIYAQDHQHAHSVIDTKSEFQHEKLNQLWLSKNVDLIVMAGYMHFWNLAPELEGKVINLHPSLIPAFSGKGMFGMHVHKAVIEKGVKFSGCTVHLVDREYDHGRILDQRCIAVESTDSPESLAAKIGPLEKSLLIQVISAWNSYRL